MAFSLSLLAFGSIFSGYFSKDLFIGFNSSFFKNSTIVLDSYTLSTAEFLSFKIKMIPVVCSLFGSFLA